MSINELNQSTDSPEQRRGKRETNISPDGKWKSFPRTPNLLQYVSNGVFYGRLKVNGKILKCSLETDVFTTAKLRLGNFVKNQRKKGARSIAGTFSEAREKYEREVDADHTLKEASKRYRHNCIKALLRTWPGLDAKAPTKITEEESREWANRFASEYDDQFFNNTLGSFRRILEKAGIPREDNPAFKVKRLGVKQKELKLPEGQQFEQLLRIIETAGERQSQHCADLVRFLAFSGCQISEAKGVRWSDVDLQKQVIRVESAKRAKTSGASLTRLKQASSSPESNVCAVSECEKSLTRGCKKLEIHRITHHDLRHLFATRCIESGVDIPTVSRWLGHSDGTALAMKTYGHLCREHSAAMALKVTFSTEKQTGTAV